MLSIWKYPFAVTDFFSLDMPQGAEVLCVQMQGAQPCIWARVNTEAVPKPRDFQIFGTGHDASDTEGSRYVGTFQLNGGALVFHLYETE